MSFPVDYSCCMPLVPLSSIVYFPGQSIEFEIIPQDYYEALFSYAKAHNSNQVALSYTLEEDGDVEGPLREVVTIIKLDYCEPVVRKGELWSYSLEASDSIRAKIVRETQRVDGFRMAMLEPFEEPKENYSLKELLRLLLPLWICSRLLAGHVDCWQSLLPSFGNASLNSYLKDINKILDFLRMYVPMSYKQKVDLLSCQGIAEKLQLMREVLLLARLNNFQSEIIRVTYNDLCLLNAVYRVRPC